MSDSESVNDSDSVRKGSAEADKPLESGHDRRSDYEGVLASVDASAERKSDRSGLDSDDLVSSENNPRRSGLPQSANTPVIGAQSASATVHQNADRKTSAKRESGKIESESDDIESIGEDMIRRDSPRCAEASATNVRTNSLGSTLRAEVSASSKLKKSQRSNTDHVSEEDPHSSVGQNVV